MTAKRSDFTKPALARVARPSPALARLEVLAAIPEEHLWLASQRSAATREAYRADVEAFMRFLGIRTTDELRQVDRGAVLAWKGQLEASGIKGATIRRRLAALSSLFAHLVHHQVLRENPCREIPRPRVNRRQGTTSAFSVPEARALLEAPDERTLQGLRDRAILSVGLQAGLRRGSIVSLRARGLHRVRGFDALRFRSKGGVDHSLAIHPTTAQRIRDYLGAAGHGEDLDGPLFRPIGRGARGRSLRRHLAPGMVNVILKRYVALVVIAGHYSAHSMRATFITRALENGASLEEVQRAAGHADPDTTKLYDRRGYNPEKSAAFYATY